MRSILFSLLAFIALSATAQTYSGQSVKLSGDVSLKGQSIYEFQKDTFFASDNKLPTSLAVKKYVEGHGGSGTGGGGGLPPKLAEYENNAEALAAGLAVGDYYRVPFNNGNVGIAQVAIPTFSRWTIFGQSNALGVGTLYEIISAINTSYDFRKEFDRVFIFNPTTGNYEKLLAGVNGISASLEYPLFGTELGIAYRWIKEHPLGELYINKFAGDGQPIANFQKGGSIYTNGLNIFTASDAWLALHNIILTDDAIEFTQGESDKGNTETYYRGKLNSLFASLVLDNIVKPYTKIVITQVSTDSDFYWAGVANAKANFVLATPNAILVEYPAYSYRADNVHLNTKGQLQLGYDCYEKVYGADHLAVTLKISNFPNNAVAFYNFEQTSGNFVDSLNLYPLVRTNGATTVTGKIGKGVNFGNNAGQFLTGSNSSAFSITDSGFAVTGWVKITSATGSTFVCGKGTGGTFEYGVFAENGALKLKINNGTTIFTSYGQTLPLNQWNFFCYRFSNNVPHYELMVNANYSTSINVPTYFTSTGNFYVGKDLTNTGLDLGCSVDLLRVFNRYVQDMEVANLYNAGNGK